MENKSKNLIIALLVLLVIGMGVFILVGDSFTDSKEEILVQPLSQSFKTYVDQNHKFSFEYPADMRGLRFDRGVSDGKLQVNIFPYSFTDYRFNDGYGNSYRFDRNSVGWIVGPKEGSRYNELAENELLYNSNGPHAIETKDSLWPPAYLFRTGDECFNNSLGIIESPDKTFTVELSNPNMDGCDGDRTGIPDIEEILLTFKFN